VTAPAPVIWSYWEDLPGRRRGDYLGLCIESLQRHAGGLELRLLGHDDARRWLPDLDKGVWESLPAPNFRSDYVRSRVLHRFGGIWADPDTIALRPLSTLLDEVDETGTLCWGREFGRFFGGLCAAAPGSPFMESWAQAQDEAIGRASNGRGLEYAALAQGVTWSLARRLPWKSLPSDQVAPVPWHEWRRFLSRVESPKRVLRSDPVTVVLWNMVMQRRLAKQTRAQLLRTHALIGRLFRIALGISSPEQEEDLLTRLAFVPSLRYSTPVQSIEKRGRTRTRSMMAQWQGAEGPSTRHVS